MAVRHVHLLPRLCDGNSFLCDDIDYFTCMIKLVGCHYGVGFVLDGCRYSQLERNRWRLSAFCCSPLLLLHELLASTFKRDGETDAGSVLHIVLVCRV